MDENLFGMGLDVATLSVDLPDPFITVSGADNYIVQDTINYPLLALNLYGKSATSPIDIVSVGDDGAIEVGSGLVVSENIELETGGFTADGLNSATDLRMRSKCYIKVVPHTQYTLTANYNQAKGLVKASVSFYSANDFITSRFSYIGWTQTDRLSFTAPEEFVTGQDNYIRILFGIDGIGGEMSLTQDDIYNVNLVTSTATATITSGLPLCSVGSVRDELVYKVDGMGKVIKRTATIDSYNGEAVTTDYISSTGGLDTGAKIVYVLATPQEIELSTAEMAELQKLQSYDGVTNILNDERAEMLVKMLRSDYDMKYVEWLKESQTWICPKAGKWKVIAVGGGASGGDCNNNDPAVLTPTVAGGTTSFGSIIAADGGASTSDYAIEPDSAISGYGGYTGTCYGGVPATAECNGAGNSGHASGVGTTAVGYGAGGGAKASSTRSYAIPGRSGAIESTIVDLEEGHSIICTVGKGGVAPLDSTGSGADGVIIVQYLGY